MIARQGSTPSRKATGLIAVAVIVALTGAESSCEARQSTRSSNDSNDSSGATDESSTEVVYSVSSNARIEVVTYIASDGKTQSDRSVGRSWSAEGPAKHGRVLVSATTSRDDAWIKCSVAIGDTVLQNASAQGTKGSRVVCDVTY